MIIIKDRKGKMCNRIWGCVPFIAASSRWQQTVVVLFFGAKYGQFFENLNCQKGVRFLLLKTAYREKLLAHILSFLEKLPGRLLRCLRVYVDTRTLEDENLTKPASAKKKSVFLINGWRHPKPVTNLTKYHASLASIFQPAKRYRVGVEDLLQRERASVDTIVGVHIRRKDYSTFKGGRYWYSDELYLRSMISVQRGFSDNDRVGFFIASDEEVNLGAFSSCNVFKYPNAVAVQDLYGLSCCDYIMGPPSTFSMWASFYGQVPLRFLVHGSMNPRPDEFSVIVGQDRFANGKKLIH